MTLQRIDGDRRSGAPDRRAAVRAADSDQVRRGIASELHDCALQLILAAHADLAEPTADPDALARTRDTLHAAIAEIRRILDGRPQRSVAERGGLRTALEVLCEQAAQRAGLIATSRIDNGATDGPHDDLVYALAREFVENAVKHAGATRLDLALRAATGAVVLTVSDDGRGIPAEPVVSGHHGLEFAAHRVSGAGGLLTIDIGGARGTTLTVSLPGHDRAEAAPAPVAAMGTGGRRGARRLPVPRLRAAGARDETP